MKKAGHLFPRDMDATGSRRRTSTRSVYSTTDPFHTLEHLCNPRVDRLTGSTRNPNRKHLFLFSLLFFFSFSSDVFPETRSPLPALPWLIPVEIARPLRCSVHIYGRFAECVPDPSNLKPKRLSCITDRRALIHSSSRLQGLGVLSQSTRKTTRDA